MAPVIGRWARLLVTAGACGALALVGVLAGSSSTAAPRGARPARPVLLAVGAAAPCGVRVRAPSYDHVMWIWMENESFGAIIGAPDAPYVTKLSRECGLAANYEALGHPSLPNYLGATGGTTEGVSDDGEPDEHPITGPSIFSEVDAAGLSWAGYAESMPRNCDTVTSGEYAARHNPAVYYLTIRRACALDDVPMGPISSGALHEALYGDRLANFVFVTPNICDDAHSCPVRTGDDWLSSFCAMVFDSPTYRAGHLAVFITWDEGNGDNHVPTVVVAPSVRRGSVSETPFTHYSLLATAESLLHLRRIGAAASATSMVAAFGL